MIQLKDKMVNHRERQNQVTIEMKEWIKELIDDSRPQLDRDLKALSPAERWQVIEKLMSYVMPKMQCIETEDDFDNLTNDQFSM